MRVLRRIIFTLSIGSLAASICYGGPTEYGTITISKIAPEAASREFSFVSPQFGEFTLADGDSMTFEEVALGDYTIQKLPTPGWEPYLVVADSTTSASKDMLDWSTCTFSLHLDAAETLSLAFHNRSLTDTPQATAPSIPAPSSVLLGTLGAALIRLRRKRRDFRRRTTTPIEQTNKKALPPTSRAF